MPLKNDIFQTFDLKRSHCTPYDDIIAKVDYIEQTDEGLKIHCKVEKEKKMNKNEELKNVDTIIITRRGNTVSVEAYEVDSGVGYPVVRHKTIAECSPDDIFDFNIGAKIAFDRLYEGYDMTPKPKRKKYTGLIYGVFNIPSIVSFPNKTSSCVYKVKNGRIVDTVMLPCHNEDDFLIYDDMTEKALCETLNELYFCCNHIINAGYLNIHDKT